MIRGVNRGVVEVNDLQDQYFERAVLYVRPGLSGEESSALLRHSAALVERLTKGHLPARRLRKVPAWAGMLASAAAGAGGMWLWMTYFPMM